MHTVVQRVSRASVTVEGEVVGAIERGLLALVGIENGDTEADVSATVAKLVGLRIFPGRTPMDRSVLDIGGQILVVSQFTLAASIRKGRRPSFDRAEAPERANPLVETFIAQLIAAGVDVRSGRFGAHMQVELVNDGPATFLVLARNGAVL